METPQFYISVTEGVYSSWRAIGVLEDLQADGDIAQFLVTLYSSQKQKAGEETSLRCVHCHCPLTLYCSTCQCPSHLALPSLPPPPSLSSPPHPTLPPQVLDTSAPLSVTSDPHHTTPVLGAEGPASHVKDEVESTGIPQDEGEFDFDDCPVDFGTVQPDSPSSAYDNGEPKTSETALTLMQHTPVGKRKCRKGNLCSGEPDVSSSRGKRKRRTTSAVSLEANISNSKKGKVVKKNKSLSDKFMSNSSEKGIQQVREGNHLTSQDNAGLPGEIEKDVSNKAMENLNKKHKEGKICESLNPDKGFIIPVDERHSAQIHMFDESFFKRHKIADGFPTYTKQTSASKNSKLKETVHDEDARQKVEALESHSAVDGVDNNVSVTRKGSSLESAELDETEKHSLRILVSAQKIPPLKAADGSYTRSLYTHFECLYCKKAFIQKRSFNKHIQKHAEENLYKCTMCDKGFESLYNLREHEKKHKLECEICGKKCTDKNDYNDHMKLHTENNGVMKCPGCAYQSTDFYMYRKHKYECAYLRPALQCEICGVHLKSVKSLKHHIAAIHRNERPYKCTLCDKSFVFKTKLNCHMKYNHAEGGRLFHCDKCGNRFIDPKGLKSHQKSVHSNEKPFKCTYCPSAFARKYTLGVHLRLHTGEKPFRCTECLQAFVQKPSLLLHLRSHHGQDSKVNKKTVDPDNCS
ncbi:uncharacterized protein LOC143274678 [Babylonia areolata]|uniref:uncharacterized protein LOC143274678 n=1 Tax=Babylonia areolata TaxID=304850 RepID=UPI003FCFE3C3